MNRDEAIYKLEEAGFKVERVEGSHWYYKRGLERIMLSVSHGELDRATAHRVQRLCSGVPTARDLVRQEHQGTELPRDIIKIRDRVVDARTGLKCPGTVVHVDYQNRTAKVKWDKPLHNGVDAVETCVIHLGFLTLLRAAPTLRELARSPSSVRAAVLEPEIIAAQGISPDEAQQLLKEEAMAEADEKQEATGTILDALASLELAAEQEYGVLLKFAKRVEAYEKLQEHAGVLGLEVEPLPFRLTNGIVPAAEPEPGVHRVQRTPKVSSPSSAPKDLTVAIEKRIISVLTELGDCPRYKLLQRFGGGQYKIASDAVERLVLEGRIASWRSGKGTFYRLVKEE